MQHPRTLGRSWLRSPLVAPRDAREAPPEPSPPAPRPFDAAVQLTLVPTTDEVLRQLGQRVHQMSRTESAAWFSTDEHERDEARRAIRDAVRDAGGGDLRDHRGRLVERID